MILRVVKSGCGVRMGVDMVGETPEGMFGCLLAKAEEPMAAEGDWLVLIGMFSAPTEQVAEMCTLAGALVPTKRRKL